MMFSKIDFTPADDKKTVTMTLSSDDAADKPAVMSLSVEQVTQIIQILGRVRETMQEGQDVPSIEGARFTPVVRTRWALQPEASTDGSVLAFQHPAYGPVGLVLTPQDSDKLMRGLHMHQEIRRDNYANRGKLN
ncbi:hypothetical protein [Acetobacter sp.]|uniref:hypothetical protein n=1 Tax=Acetobacter sp. TaxID=440 RepID=UPI0039EA002F